MVAHGLGEFIQGCKSGKAAPGGVRSTRDTFTDTLAGRRQGQPLDGVLERQAL